MKALRLFCLLMIVCMGLSSTCYGHTATKICLKNNRVVFNTEVVATRDDLRKGLMYRKQLARQSAMLFIFPKAQIEAAWMKNTLIPLDMLWLDENQTVVAIHKNLQPCRVTNCPQVQSPVPVRYLLEINAGLATEYDLKVGDRLNFPCSE